MTDSQPLVSILIITMNHEKFIEQACRSAIEQTYANKEIIFVDNHSEDQTARLARNILEKSGLPVTFVETDSRKIVSINLNLMLARASGKYLAILSGDDWWLPELIEQKVQFASANSSDYVLSDGFKYLQDSGEITAAYPAGEKERIIKTLPRFFHENVAGNRTVNVGTFVKTELLKKEPFDENIQTEDWDMNLRFAHQGHRIHFLDKKLFYYRVLSNSVSRNISIMEESYRKVTAKYLDYILAHDDTRTEYQLNELLFKYEKLLSDAASESEKEKIRLRWKAEKYDVKYKNPVRFFKKLLLKISG